MKKSLFLICSLIILFLMPSCIDDGSADLCKALGSHNSKYVIEGDMHWLECQQEGCAYKTEPEAHSGGTATCNSKAKCAACGTLYGEYAEHDMKYVSDGDQTHTYRCAFSGCSQANDPQPHSGGTPTCTEPSRCEICGGFYGETIAHTLDSDGVSCATCQENYFALTLKFQLSEDGNSYIVSRGENCTAEHIVIPSEYAGKPVTAIGYEAFVNMPIKSIVIPDGIKTIGESAFSSCVSLKSIEIPDSVETIEKYAFSCCLGLESITIGSGIKVLEEDVFGGANIKSILIPSNVETIGMNAFGGCNRLEEVVIEDGVKNIDQWAFAGCDNLKKVVLPNTLEYMEARTFEDSPAIECNIYKGMKYLGSATNPYFALVGSAGATQLVPHTDTVFYMSEALYNCEDIVSVEVGPNVKFIGLYALSGMDALEVITVHSGNPYYYAINNLLVDKRTNIPVQACKTSVIPSDGSITELDLEIFTSISTVETIYVPKSIQTLYMSFQYVNGLKAIIIESDVSRIIVHGNYDGCRGGETKKCFAVYHCRTEEQWKNVNVEYTFSRTGMIRPTDCYGDYATHYFYSETEPTGEGNYWHYVDGVPTPWENSTSSETEE